MVGIRWRALAAKAGEVQVRVRIDEPRQQGDVSQIDIGRALAVRFHRGDAFAGNGHDPTRQRPAVDREHPAGGESLQVHRRRIAQINFPYLSSCYVYGWLWS